jgi:acyl carrier protein
VAAGATVQRLIALAARRFAVDAAALQPDDDVFDSLGVDSVQVLELLSELEREFDVEIPDYELREVRSFADLGRVIDRRLI